MRWAAHLRALGHSVRVGTRLAGIDGEGGLSGETCELLIALHALRSTPSIERFVALAPRAPLVVVLTGTDLYGGPGSAPALRRALLAATRIVVLQASALGELDPALRAKTRVIVQGAASLPASPAESFESFEVLALAHLREVKDPLLLAQAMRGLPRTSRLRAFHLGGAHEAAWLAAAQAENRTNPRWCWLGDVPRRASLTRLAGARLFVSTSRSEGGSAALSEALAAAVPVLATRIPAAESLLGRDHPGLFPVGDAAALTGLLRRAEEEPEFLAELRARSLAARDEVSPRLERERIAALLAELVPSG